MRIIPSLLLVSSLLLTGVACSGGNGGGVEALEDGGLTDDGGLFGTDAKSDGGGATDTANTKDMSIDPLGQGYEWNYNVTILGTYFLCTGGAQQGKVVGTMSHDGKPGYRVQSLCPKAGISDYTASGDKVEVRVLEAGPWELALDAPVAEGKSWTNSYGTFAWHAIPPESVGGVLQAECWQAKDKNGPTYTNYCRGVGPTHWHVEDKAGNGYDAVLTSVNF